MLRKIILFILKAILAYLLLTVIHVVLLKWVPVWHTPLMLKRSIEYREDSEFKTHKKWVRLEKISPNLVKASIASEDNLFETHNGFDWEAIKKEVEKSSKSGKAARGCSTISQQTAKNVFTFGGRSFFRKGVEMWYTFLIEKIWGKRRIMEVYLNVAEMGKGIYGAEAAARAFYSKHASELSMAEAAMIVACYPNPLKRNPAKPTKYLYQRQKQIMSLVPKLKYSPELLENPLAS